MKKILFSLVLLLAATTAMATDWGTMKTGTTYEVTSNSDSGTFTAEKAGVLTITSSTSEKIEVYSMNNIEVRPSVETTNQNKWTGQFKLAAGKYNIYSPLFFTSPYTFTMSFETGGTAAMTVKSVDPADGSAISLGTAMSGQISVYFNAEPKWSSVTVKAGSVSEIVTAHSGINYSIFFETKDVLMKAVDKGMKAGDPITVTIDGLCVVGEENVKYNGNGKLTLNYTLKNVPTVLSSNTLGAELRSFYMSNDEAGKPKFVFSNKIKEIADVSLRFGDIDRDADGEYYRETLVPIIDGNTVTIDLTGKVRTPGTMIPTSISEYTTMALVLSGVKDVNGDYVTSNGTGSIGSFGYNLPFSLIEANIAAEFYPASGSDISGLDNIEAFIMDYDKMEYSGVAFTAGEVTDTVAKPNIKATYNKMDEGYDVVIPIPEVIKAAGGDITMTFANLQTADGQDHSSALTATYKKTSSAISGAKTNSLVDGKFVKNGEVIVRKKGRTFKVNGVEK